VLFSGGVDSALIAEAAGRRGLPTLLTIGVPGSADLGFVRSILERWGPTPDLVEVSETEILAEAEGGNAFWNDASPVARSVIISLSLALRRSAPGIVLCGQGADELFLGYAHFRGLDPRAASARATVDLADLLEREWPRTLKVASALGRDLRAPFLDPEFISAAQRLPIVERSPGRETKRPLRALARARGIPEAICSRPKRALQYSSGVDRILRRGRMAGPTSPGQPDASGTKNR
jgi:asparagine synthase (glutamine-hydrolysing)